MSLHYRVDWAHLDIGPVQLRQLFPNGPTLPTYAMNSDYSFKIDILSNCAHPPKIFLRQGVQIRCDQANFRIAGIVSAARGPRIEDTGFAYVLTIHSPLYLMNFNCQPRTFTEVSLASLIRTLCQAYQLQFELELKLESHYPQINAVQWLENDYQFLTQLLNQWALFFVFDSSHAHPILLISDSISQCERIKLDISHWHEQCKLGPEHLLYEDFESSQALRPARISTHNETDIPGHGTWRVSGSQPNRGLPRQYLAGRHQAQIDGARSSLIVDTHQAHARPGCIVELELGPDSHHYIIEQAQITLDLKPALSHGTARACHYNSRLLLRRLNSHYAGLRLGARPKPAVTTATIMSNEWTAEGPYYQLRYDFETQDVDLRPRAQALQMFAGWADTGSQFRLEVGVKVLVGFIDGNINHPVILSALNFQPEDSPVVATNCHQSILCSPARTGLLFDEGQSDAGITLAVEHGPRLIMRSQTASAKLALDTEQGQFRSTAAGQIYLQAGGRLALQVRGSYTRHVGQSHQLELEGALLWRAGQNLFLKCQSLHSVSAGVEFKSLNSVRIETEQFALQSSAAELCAGQRLFMHAGRGIELSAQRWLRIEVNGALLELTERRLRILSPSQIALRATNCLEAPHVITHE